MSNSVNNLLELITKKINTLSFVKEPEGLYLPVDYCLKNGGKRIRPLMTLLGCELFEGDIDNAVNVAIGMELLHNFTLIHDDIMDEALIRRGEESVYKKWGVNTAILSGDALLALAYEYIANVPEKHLKNVLRVFNKTIIEVCEGQQYDMDFENRNDVTEEEYLKMIRLKTAVLPANCLKIGAMLSGNAQEADLENLYSFGEMIGLAFQIQDDRLDIYADEKVFGKKIGGDIIANKKTWLYIKALEIADNKQKSILTDAINGKFTNNEDKVNAVKSVYYALSIEKLSLEKISSYFDKALYHLNKISVIDDKKKPLRELAKGLLERSY